ncbi:MAG TPA: GNAT family N-acetyltransferase, partial [Steroidobacteraceae bacterium]|nr:GNAT family N-acetyltransferase [Steroidobacteraceae bacterium]
FTHEIAYSRCNSRLLNSLVQIRSAKPSEANLLTAIAVAAKQYWGYSPQAMQGWESMLEVSIIAIEMNPTFVAAEGEIQGFYMLSHGISWELEHLWVSPQFIRRGVGKKLLMHGAEFFGAHGGSKLHIDADPNAESFYRACGAVFVDNVAAPIAENPHRVRPQLILNVN